MYSVTTKKALSIKFREHQINHKNFEILYSKNYLTLPHTFHQMSAEV